MTTETIPIDNIRTTVTRGGTTYQQNVAKIGKHRPAVVRSPAPLTDDQRAAIAESAYMRPIPGASVPTSVEEAITSIMLYIMSSPLNLREELLRRLREIMNTSIADLETQP